MVKRAGLLKRLNVNKGLLLALVVSALLHALLMDDAQRPDWLLKSAPPPINVVLQAETPLKIAAVAKPTPVKTHAHVTKPVTRPPEPAAASAQAVTSADTPAGAPSQDATANNTLPDTAAAEADSTTAASDARYAAINAEAEAAEQAQDAQNATLNKPPSLIDADFLVTKGGMSGAMHNRFEVTADGRYTLRSVAEVKGLAALFLSGKLTQTSEGMINANGLQPSQFFSQYGDNADKSQRASFDWQNGVLTMENGKISQTAPLAEGTQDFLSFMYQFMYEPPLNNMQLTIANGKRVRTYDYSFAGEETLVTKVGDLRTIHIYRSSDASEEKTDLWLAADYHYMPVKLRKTEKDGTVLEQVVTHIATSDSSANP